MTSNPHEPSAIRSASTPAEETLRLIASLPAPVGLEERVQTAVSAARRATPRRGRLLAWPGTARPENSWMRSAAAAAIVFVVAGGGWGVYMGVEQPRFDQNGPAKVFVMPTHMPATGGFTGAGAIRTPVTLPGPKAPHVIKKPVAEPTAARKAVTNPKAPPETSPAHP